MSAVESQPLLGGTPSGSRPFVWKRFLTYVGIISATALGGAVLLIFLSGSKQVSLAKAVQTDNVFAHVESLSEISKKFPKYSRSPKNGYNASVEYVISQLSEHTDYDIEVQTFPIQNFKDVSKPKLIVSLGDGFTFNTVDGSKSYEPESDFITLSDSGSNVLGEKQLQLIRGGGCTIDQYAASHFQKGNVVILNRDGTECTYRVKIATAIKAGASGVLMYASSLAGTEPVLGRCVGCMDSKVPGLGLSAAVGQELVESLAASGGKVFVSITTDTAYEIVITSNVIATTPAGREDKIIVAGSHLDSVPQGPGMNDDGSGSSATLEVALSLYRTGLSKKLVNKVRFAWWAAEELGLLGSYYYVRNLNATKPEELKKIVLNLNDDMLASPNYVRAIYNGREAEAPINPKLRGPSGVIQDVFEGWFDHKGLTHETTPFDGRSDYGGFLDFDIPAGGLFTGAEKIKTPEQVALFGGIAGVPLDPCYHQACDDISNVSGPGKVVLGEMASALAYAVQRFAFEKDIDQLLAGEIAIGKASKWDP